MPLKLERRLISKKRPVFGRTGVWEIIQLLKAASSTVHPTDDIQGNPLTSAKKLLEQDFEPPKNSRATARGIKYDEVKKKAVTHMLAKLRLFDDGF